MEPPEKQVELRGDEYRVTRGAKRPQWIFSFTNLMIMVLTLGFVYLIAVAVSGVVSPVMDWLFSVLGI